MLVVKFLKSVRSDDVIEDYVNNTEMKLNRINHDVQNLV
jgi:hypothetical protein